MSLLPLASLTSKEIIAWQTCIAATNVAHHLAAPGSLEQDTDQPMETFTDFESTKWTIKFKDS